MPDNLYRRGGIWWGRIQVNRREHRRSLRTRSRAEARKRLDAWLAEVEHERWHGQPRYTWIEAVTRYMAEVAPSSLKPSAVKRYQVSLRQLSPFLAPLRLADIKRRTVAEVITARKKSGATNATIRRDLTAMSRVLAACVEWGWIDENPARTFDRSMLRERRDPIQPPEDADVAAAVGKAHGMLADMIRFLDLTGCRQEEAAGLEWRQLDLDRGELQLVRTKTGRPRRIGLSQEARALVAALPRSLVGRYVFWHGTGSRYANVASRFRSIILGLEKAAQKDGTPFRRFRCHDLRHRYAIRELQNGRDIYELSRHLGHTSVKTTEIYLAFVHRGESARDPAQRERFLGSDGA